MISRQQLWLVWILIMFMSAKIMGAQSDGKVGMVTRFITKLGNLLEDDDLSHQLGEDQPNNLKELVQERPPTTIKTKTQDQERIDGGADKGLLLRTLTAHIPCR